MNPLKFAVVVMALVSVSAVLAFGQSSDPWIGTWKFNTAESKYNPGPEPQSGTVKLVAMQGGLTQATFDWVQADGRHTKNVGTPHTIDGKVSPTPNQPNTTQSFKHIDRGYERTITEDGKVVFSSIWVVSADGKKMTITQKGRDGQRKTVSNIMIYDKQ